MPLGVTLSYLASRGHADAYDDLIYGLHEGDIRTIADMYAGPSGWQASCPGDTPPPPCVPMRTSVPAPYWNSQYEELLMTECHLRVTNGDHVEVYDYIKLCKDDLDRIWRLSPSAVHPIADKPATTDKAKRSGPAPGTTGFEVADDALLPEIDEMLKNGEARSSSDAARKLAKKGKVQGQSEESQVRRLSRRYRSKRN